MSGFMASGRGPIYRPGRRARLRRGWRDCWCDPPGGGRDRGQLPLFRGLGRAERHGRGGHARRV